MVGKLPQWYSQHSLIAVGSRFLRASIRPGPDEGPRLSSGRIRAPWADVSTLGLVLIRGVSDGTKVSGSDDKTSERQQHSGD